MRSGQEPTVKDEQLRGYTHDNRDGHLTTDQGILVDETDNSLRAGERGPTLLEDFHLREKVTRFDHERIPERVVHARGSAAHGYFQVYRSLEEHTSAEFLCDPDRQTPVFVRFSTVQGPRGSADTVRDVRGFATKFYTSQGNFDLVGNNMPSSSSRTASSSPMSYTRSSRSHTTRCRPGHPRTTRSGTLSHCNRRPCTTSCG